jgi:hypothetical protein
MYRTVESAHTAPEGVIGSGAFLTGAYRGWLVRPDRHQ